MTDRSEVARRVAERLGLDVPAIGDWEGTRSILWDALISSEQRVEELEAKERNQFMRANDKRPNTPHAVPHVKTLACHAPPHCRIQESQASINERFLEAERNNHSVSIAEWEQAEQRVGVLEGALREALAYVPLFGPDGHNHHFRERAESALSPNPAPKEKV